MPCDGSGRAACHMSAIPTGPLYKPRRQRTAIYEHTPLILANRLMPVPNSVLSGQLPN